MAFRELSKVRTERRAISGGVIVLELSFPPSTNNLYPTVNGKRRISEEYAAWKLAAGWELKRQRPSCAVGRVHIAITLQDRSRAFDPDNRNKALIDLLVSHGIIESDSNKIVRRIVTEVDESGSIHGARVEISPAPSQQQRRAVG